MASLFFAFAGHGSSVLFADAAQYQPSASLQFQEHTTFAEELTTKASTTKIKAQGAHKLVRGSSRRGLEDGLYGSWARKKHDSSDEEDCEHLAEKHDITCAPSTSPSETPSGSPSLSSAPTISSAPSGSPSGSPSRAPTRTPSANPTGAPSLAPTKLPTGTPSVVPTGAPSLAPTKIPTGTPSVAPTSVPYANMVLTRDDGSTWQENTCQTSLPAGASAPQAEETEFEYFLKVLPGSNPDESLKLIEQALAIRLAEEILSCGFAPTMVTTSTLSASRNTDNSTTTTEQYDEPVRPFETYAISSLPSDARSSSKTCPDEMVNAEEYTCYSIHAGFTPTFFYRNNNNGNGLRHNRRNLQTEMQLEIVQVFGPVLLELLDSGEFNGGNVVNTTYSGFLLSPESTQDEYEETGGSISGIETNQATNGGTGGGGGSNNTNIMIGGVTVGLAAVALLVIAALLVQRRKDAALNRTFDVVEDDGDLSLEEASIDESKYDTRSIQEGFPAHKTQYVRSSDTAGGEGIEINEFPVNDFPDHESVQSMSMVSGRYPLGSIDESSTIGGASNTCGLSALQGLQYHVVNDDATVDDSLFGLDSNAGGDSHDYANCRSDNCFKCRGRALPQPTFVKADLHAIQTDLGSNKKYQPKYERSYTADDTVEL